MRSVVFKLEFTEQGKNEVDLYNPITMVCWSMSASSC